MNVNAAQLGLGALFAGTPSSSEKTTVGDKFFSLLSSLLTGTENVAASCVENGNAGETCVAETDSELMSAGIVEDMSGDCDADDFEIDDSVAMPVVLFAAIPSADGTKTVSVSISGVEGDAFRPIDTANGKSRVAIPVEVTASVEVMNADSTETGYETVAVQVSALLFLDESALTDGIVSQPELVLLPNENDTTEMAAADLLAGLISPATPMESFIPDYRIVDADEAGAFETGDVDVSEVFTGDDGESIELDTIDAAEMIFIPDMSQWEPMPEDDFAWKSGDSAGFRFASMTEATDFELENLGPESGISGSGDWNMPGEPTEDNVLSIPSMGDQGIPVDEAISASGDTETPDVPLSNADDIFADVLFTSVVDTDDSSPAGLDGGISVSPQGDDIAFEIPGNDISVTLDEVSGETEDAGYSEDAGYFPATDGGDETFGWTDFEPFPEAEVEAVSVADVRTLLERFTADDGTVRLTVEVRPEAGIRVDDSIVSEEMDETFLADGEISETVSSGVDEGVDDIGMVMEEVLTVSDDDAGDSVPVTKPTAVPQHSIHSVRVSGSRAEWVIDRTIPRIVTQDGPEVSGEADDAALTLSGDDSVTIEVVGNLIGDSGMNAVDVEPPSVIDSGEEVSPLAKTLNSKSVVPPESNAVGNFPKDEVLSLGGNAFSRFETVLESAVPDVEPSSVLSGTSPETDTAQVVSDNRYVRETPSIPVRITRMTRETGLISGKSTAQNSEPENGSAASESAVYTTEALSGGVKSTGTVLPDETLTDQSAGVSFIGTDVAETGYLPRTVRFVSMQPSVSDREMEASPDDAGLETVVPSVSESGPVAAEVTENVSLQADMSGISSETPFSASMPVGTVTGARALTSEKITADGIIPETDENSSIPAATNAAPEEATSRPERGTTAMRISVKKTPSAVVSHAATVREGYSDDVARTDAETDAPPLSDEGADPIETRASHSTDTMFASENSAVALSDENGKVTVSRNAGRSRRMTENDTAAVSTVSTSGEGDGEPSGGMGDSGTGLAGRGMTSSFTNDGATIPGGSAKFGETLSRKVAETDSSDGNLTAAALPADASSVSGTAGTVARSRTGHRSSGTGETGKSVLDSIVRQAKVLLGNGQSSATVLLDPPSLGRLKLEILTEGSKVSGKIIVESKEVQDIVRNNITELRQNLAQNGLQVESFDVQVGHNDGTDGWARREDMESTAALLRSSREQRGGTVLGASTVTDSRGRNISRHPGSLDVWM